MPGAGGGEEMGLGSPEEYKNEIAKRVQKDQWLEEEMRNRDLEAESRLQE